MTDSAIPVRVAVRARPLSEKEETAGCQDCVMLVPGRPQILIKNSDKAFTFDYAFAQNSTQEEVYNTAVRPLIDQLFKGYNATVLAYGQTGSGKTHSMGTCTNQSTPLDLEGVIPRAVREIFARMNSMDYEFNICVTFVELYKEQLYDLLSTQSKKKEDCVVDLREDPKVGVIIANLTEAPVNNLESTLLQLEVGSQKRVTAATAMNAVSSRSHAIFTITIQGVKKELSESSVDLADDNTPTSFNAKFHLVDLAGSERADKTKATGVRYKEGVSINLGLLALGNVISALGSEDSKSRSHINYRDSKLTRLLQDSLGGNSYTLMVACVSPADSNVDETLSTLRYADRARKIKNKPIVNRDDKESEILHLRKEVQELRSQLGIKNGEPIFRVPSLTANEKEEYKRLQERFSITMQENNELTLALCACQGELSFINEKLMLSEEASETMKTKLAELLAEAEAVSARSEAKDDIQTILSKIFEVINAQKAGEKTLHEHEASRLESDASGMSENNEEENDEDEGGNDEHHETFNAAHALKQNALSNQLANLNKVLAQKEQLASTMATNESNLQELKTKYEANIKELQSEMEAMAKERETLQQQVRVEPASGKIAEQRRKRIQELEQSMQDLRKKVVEQERIIKTNEKSAAQIKQLAEEIRTIKQQKVKLVRQMKEEAEQVRVWKQKKEREVLKLKQNERKQQFQITRMENLHVKQQNVLRRKMEEAMASNKRLREVLEKQKNARKISRDVIDSKGGLAGAAERMRSVVTQELDMVVSVKEATQSRLQLVEDRKTLMKQLNDLKKKSRVTMVNTEREDLQQKMSELQSELDLRNAEITDLQKQIMSADQDKEKDGGRNWWDTAISTMTEARIALQYLFEKAADSMVSASSLSKEKEELRILYDEAVKNTTHLEEEISRMKIEQNDEKDRLSRNYEERVMLLLSKLSQNDTEIKDTEIQKFYKVHEELLKMREETEQTRKTSKREAKARKAEEDLEDMFSNDDDDDDDEEDESESDSDDGREHDPDWYQTPLFRRIRKMREANNTNRNNTTATEESSILKRKFETADENCEPALKRKSDQTGCSCKTGCKNNRCACRKANEACSEKCRCPPDQCINHATPSAGLRRSDVLNEMSADNTAGTMSLLNDTYDVSIMGNSKRGLLNAESPSPKKRHTVDENVPPTGQSPALKRQPYFKSPSKM